MGGIGQSSSSTKCKLFNFGCPANPSSKTQSMSKSSGSKTSNQAHTPMPVTQPAATDSSSVVEATVASPSFSNTISSTPQAPPPHEPSGSGSTPTLTMMLVPPDVASNMPSTSTTVAPMQEPAVQSTLSSIALPEVGDAGTVINTFPPDSPFGVPLYPTQTMVNNSSNPASIDAQNVSNHPAGKSNVGKIVGGVLGGIAALVLLILGAHQIWRYRQAKRTPPSAEFLAGHQNPFSGGSRLMSQRLGTSGFNNRLIDDDDATSPVMRERNSNSHSNPFSSPPTETVELPC